MKLQVKECRKSFKYTNMWVVTYTTTTVDFFTGVETVKEHHIFSKVEVKPGEVDVVKKFSDDNSKFWIEAIKEDK